MRLGYGPPLGGPCSLPCELELMRRRVALLSLLIGLAGCVGTETTPHARPWQALKLATEAGPDRVLLEVGLVQTPLEDPFLDRELWTGADEMLGSAAQREMLDANGLRVGL